MMENFYWVRSYTRAAGTGFTVNTCPMIPNWQGLPAMVKWANDENVSLNIIAVRYPEALSLASLSADELAGIAGHYHAASISATDSNSLRNLQRFNEYIGYVEQWQRYKQQKERLTGKTTQTNHRSRVRNNIELHLLLSSASANFKESQVQMVIGSLDKAALLLSQIHPSLADAFWNLKASTGGEQLLNESAGKNEAEQLQPLRYWAGEHLDELNDAHASAKATHLQRLQACYKYYQLIYPERKEIADGINRWMRFIESQKHEEPLLQEAFFSLLNKGRIAYFVERIGNLVGYRQAAGSEMIDKIKTSLREELLKKADINHPVDDAAVQQALSETDNYLQRIHDSFTRIFSS
jgi:hypothetical protein